VASRLPHSLHSWLIDGGEFGLTAHSFLLKFESTRDHSAVRRIRLTEK
jgi:hypothetical protein